MYKVEERLIMTMWDYLRDGGDFDLPGEKATCSAIRTIFKEMDTHKPERISEKKDPASGRSGFLLSKKERGVCKFINARLMANRVLICPYCGKERRAGFNSVGPIHIRGRVVELGVDYCNDCDSYLYYWKRKISKEVYERGNRGGGKKKRRDIRDGKTMVNDDTPMLYGGETHPSYYL